MAVERNKKVGYSLAGAGVGILGVAVVFGLTTEGGGIDWVGVIMALAGVIMIFSGLFQAHGGTSHTA